MGILLLNVELRLADAEFFFLKAEICFIDVGFRVCGCGNFLLKAEYRLTDVEIFC